MYKANHIPQFNFNLRDQTYELDQEFALALDLLMSVFQDNYDIGLKWGNKSNLCNSVCKEEINTRLSFLVKTQFLLRSGYCSYYRYAKKLANEQPRNKWAYFLKHQMNSNTIARKYLYLFQDEGLLEKLRYFDLTADDLDMNVATLAYDIAKAVSYIRRAFTVDLIPEKEAWELLQEARVLAISSFDSWQEYNKSYLLGLFFNGSENKDVDVEKLMYCYHFLLKEKESPWNKFKWR